MNEAQIKQAIEQKKADISFYAGEAEKATNDINYFKSEIERRQNDLYFYEDKQATLKSELVVLEKQLNDLPKGQLLYMPIHNSRITAGYKNAQYRKEFGFNHYGVDYTDRDRKDTNVYGMGVGKVLKAGYDAKTGNTLVIQYDNVQLADGSVKSVIIRMWHFAKLHVTTGQAITRDTLIANYGATGTYASGAHLHLEVDTCLDYPYHSPSFSGNTTIIKAGTDTTLNPTAVLNLRTNQVNPQTLIGSTSSDCWVKADLGYREC